MALIPPQYFDSVVAIEHERETGEHRTVATGFLVGFLTGSKNDDGKNLYYLYLVTNRHVFDNEPYVWLRFNKKLGAQRYKLQLMTEKKEKIWRSHSNPDVDIAVVKIDPNRLKADNIIFEFVGEEHMAFLNIVKNEGITPGDGVFVLGFPMGIAGKEKNYVIVRSGIVARFDDELLDVEKAFLIDASIFPGNSGGPVFLKPEVTAISGTNAISRCYLLGVISRYLLHENKENSGLACVVPIEYIRDVVQKLDATLSASQVREAWA